MRLFDLVECQRAGLLRAIIVLAEKPALVLVPAAQDADRVKSHVFTHVEPNKFLFRPKGCFVNKFTVSVFPTPIGRRNSIEGVGRSGNRSPQEERCNRETTSAMTSAWARIFALRKSPSVLSRESSSGEISLSIL